MNKKAALKTFLQSFTDVSDGATDHILSYFRSKTYKRGTTIINAGDICTEFFFILTGCLRVYFLTEQGNEKTRHIAIENQPISALSSFINEQPSVEILEAVENTELLSISRSDFFTLTNQYSEWLKFYTFFLETAYIGQTKRIEWRITMTAKERFDSIKEEIPEFMDRLPNKLLASFLDIAPETLSRLKAQD